MCFPVNQSFDQSEAILNSATQGNSTPVGMIEKNTRLPGYHRQITDLITYQFLRQNYYTSGTNKMLQKMVILRTGKPSATRIEYVFHYTAQNRSPAVVAM
jgi:hypothetical protein